jgi:lipopolysaccharide assembly outer membrane protein LptD (OstA)
MEAEVNMRSNILLISAFVLTSASGQPAAEMTLVRNAAGVQITAARFALYADQGTCKPQAGEVDARGHVRVNLPARSDHHLFRYEKESLVTGDAVELAADRIQVRNQRLVATGHVLVRATGAQLHADELEIYLPSGEGTLRGSVQVVRQGQGRRGTPEFPPEIIK